MNEDRVFVVTRGDYEGARVIGIYQKYEDAVAGIEQLKPVDWAGDKWLAVPGMNRWECGDEFIQIEGWDVQ